MSGSHPRIGQKQLDQLRRQGPAVADWQRRVGLAEAQARCVSMILAGLVPFVGWLWLDWNPVTMLAFLAVDVAAVLLGDALKLLIAPAAVLATHTHDYRTQQILSIVGGLEDGTGTYTEYGKAVRPGMLFALTVVFAAVVTLLVGLGIEQLGMEPTAVHREPGFLMFAAASLLLHVLGALRGGWRARRASDGQGVLYLDGGGVIGLGAGLLFLVWLPITLGSVGTVLMLAVLLLFRLGFGVFALIYIPKVTAALDRHLQSPPTAEDLARLKPPRRGPRKRAAAAR